METKQVLVVRKDLKMRKGKIAAQCAHASMSFITRRLQDNIALKLEQQHWLSTGFAKICVYVESEEELFAVFNAARAAGIEVHLITDSGRTAFHGVATNTCLALGPDDCDKIDKISGHLKLL